LGGSLGQGLSNTVGCAYSSKYFDNNPNRYYCILGDGESAEGSVWEAAHFAGLYKLDNLTVILDCNRLGQSDITSLSHNCEVYANRFEQFGFKVVIIDGHDVDALIGAYAQAREHKGSPFVIVAKTFKGHGFGDISDKVGHHGKAVKNSKTIEDLKSKIKTEPKFEVTLPSHTYKYEVLAKEQRYSIDLSYQEGKKYSNREGFGMALKKLGKLDGNNTVIVGLDGDVKNSTFSEMLYQEYPNKFINCYIAEQNMISIATAVSKRNKIPFIATFSTFYTRAFDQIRMGAISMDNVKFAGTHSGCHIGEDGPSQMGLEDIALFRAVPNMTVLCPSDIISAERATELAANHQGSVFIRLGRNATGFIYNKDTKFEIGKFNLLKSTDKDVITLIGHGQTTFEILAAEEILSKEGINVRVIDLFSVKPLDKEGLISNIKQTNGLCLVVEDHYYEGGAGEAVKSAVSEEGFKVLHQAVNSIPRSGSPSELYDYYGLSPKFIVERVKKALSKN